MAPLKSSQSSIIPNFSMKTISTRSKSTIISQKVTKQESFRTKRKADCSPSKDPKVTKRPALGERNINITDIKKPVTRKVTTQIKTLESLKTGTKPKQNENIPPGGPILKITTKKTNKIVPNQTALKSKPKEAVKNSLNKCNKRLSNDFEKTDENGSMYVTASEDNNDSTYFSAKKSLRSSDQHKASNVSMVAKEMESKLNLGNHEVPENVTDFDKENWNDVYQVSHYAMDIFNYFKERETKFQITDYLDRQICLSRWMRSLLVDWMVEIQESFELNHETLYLGVKLVDMYLGKMTVGKETLQLVGAAAMFVASKYDERIPPLMDDFLYICDGAYSRRELIRMEINLLKVCDFNLGIPISYRFLRRYARCAKVTMPILTLARFILEYSLMNYDTITIKDSKIAAAALYIALRMKNAGNWTPTLEFYTGYKLDEFKDVVLMLNTYMRQPIKSQLMTVRNKYSHKIFFEVAKTPLLENDQL